MGDLTAHFSRREFVCRDGTTHEIACGLLAMLEAIRSHFGPVTVTSGYRSPQYNKNVGGATSSYHIKGMAADIQVVHASPQKVYDWVDEKFPICGLGLYERGKGGWVHVDCRDFRARWTG
jgi:uncharacterized protein YcbK (DUF882 family)